MATREASSEWSDSIPSKRITYETVLVSKTRCRSLTYPKVTNEPYLNGLKRRRSNVTSDPVNNEDVAYIVGQLKACAKQKDLRKGCQIHTYVQEHKSLEKDCFIASTLISMYARCGVLAKAQQVFSVLVDRDVVTWTSLIAGYVQQGQGGEALKCFDHMQQEGHSPNEVTFTCALKACGSIGAAAKGEEIHNQIVILGMLDKDIVLGSALVDMYVRLGAIASAQQVFQGLPVRNVVIWTALIAGFLQQGQDEEALICFDSMRKEGHCPNAVTFTCALRACGNTGSITKGEIIRNDVVSLRMLEKDIVLGNALVDMYARCGALPKAYQALKELPVRDVVTWSALIAGYASHGQGEEALKCFDRMQQEGHSPDIVTFTCALKACARTGAAAKGEQIHDMIVSFGLLGKDIVLDSALVDMYARCGELVKAQGLIDYLPARNVVTWNALIAGYLQQGKGELALKLFDSMQCEGLSPDAVTFTCALKACGSIGASVKGKRIHDKIVNLGMLERDVALASALIEMYARCCSLEIAQQVFNELPVWNAVTWTTLIEGYTQQGQSQDALTCFDRMVHEGHSPNAVTFTCVLKACGSIGAILKGERIHDKIVSLGLLVKSLVLGNTLVDMYARCGALAKAQLVLDELPVRDVVTWNGLIAGCAQQGLGEKALMYFDSMLHEGHAPDIVTFSSALKACGNIGAAVKGEQIHKRIVSCLLERDIILVSILIDMYVKCGVLEKAIEVLEELPYQDVVIWNTLIGGYAQQGQSDEAFSCLEMMQLKGLSPDSATLVCLLNTCNHTGLLDEAETYILRLSKSYTITLHAEHHCLMVDIFSRAGNFKKAIVVIEMIPSANNLLVWLALLGAAHKWGDPNIGRSAFEYALCLDKNGTAAYSCMANIYTTTDMQMNGDNIAQ